MKNSTVLSFVFALVLSLSILLSFGGCAGKGSVDKENSEGTKASFEYEYNSFIALKDGSNVIKGRVDFDFSAFNADSTEENEDVAKLAFKLSSATETYVKADCDYSESYKNLESFYGKLGLKNLYFNDGYKTKPTAESIGFGIGYRKVDASCVVILTIRGLEYENEWSSNTKVGTTGDHAGFYLSAQNAYARLKTYIADNFGSGEKVKLLVTGYSRAGAVAEMIGKIMDDDAEYKRIAKTDLYVYAFNPPKITVKENNVELYSNIFVYSNSNDMIGKLLTPWGFNHVGIVKDIFSPSLYGFLRENFIFSAQEFSEAEFDYFNVSVTKKEDGDIKTLDDFYEKTFEVLLLTPKDDTDVSISTREKFMRNLQPAIEYIISLAFDGEHDYIGALSKFDKNKVDLTFIVQLLTKNSSLVYQEVSALFNDANLPYNSVKLKSACDAVQGLLQTYLKNDFGGIATVGATGYYNMHYILANHVMEGADYLLDLYFSS